MAGGMAPEFHAVFFWLQLAGLFTLVGYMAWAYVRSIRMRPHFTKADIVYQEWRASGCSQRNIITKLGGGRGCIRLVVTDRLLWVTSWFPFSVFLPLYDMSHVIPLKAITDIRRSRFLWWPNTVLLTYADVHGRLRTLRLIPRSPEAFLERITRANLAER
jgi:hypothetical protein